MDLYATLDVPRDASPAVLRAAYRRRAKSVHPDGGGSGDDFANLNRSLKVLSDPEKRAHYDRTGRVEDIPAGTAEGRAMEFAFSALNAAIGGCNAQHVDPAKVDLVAMGIESIQNAIRENVKKGAAADRECEKARRLGKRLKARRGKTGVLVTMWAANLAGMEANARKMTADNPTLERAIEILKDHRFEKEPTPTLDEMRRSPLAFIQMFDGGPL